MTTTATATLSVGDLVTAKVPLNYGIESPGPVYTIKPATHGAVKAIEPGDIAVIAFEGHVAPYRCWNEERTVALAFNREGRTPRTLDQLRNVKLGDMTREEARLVVGAACDKLAAELATNRPAIEAILNEKGCHRCNAPLMSGQYTPNGADMPTFCSFECYMDGRA